MVYMIFNKNIYLFYESINIFQITFISNKNLYINEFRIRYNY